MASGKCAKCGDDDVQVVLFGKCKACLGKTECWTCKHCVSRCKCIDRCTFCYYPFFREQAVKRGYCVACSAKFVPGANDG